ncbi:hypothetical protein G7Y89_g6556 [Cudoniella acicularis]|uniref:Uncharacterized protein n=1 Tax=Cudoniella acicularis TaxID=354080 RepID=A0A8H4RLQ3_9HELO|nr:hypothetical protein G7Y89_g6556 [Cudoniella acicularis]
MGRPDYYTPAVVVAASRMRQSIDAVDTTIYGIDNAGGLNEVTADELELELELSLPATMAGHPFCSRSRVQQSIRAYVHTCILVYEVPTTYHLLHTAHTFLGACILA